MNKLTQFSLFIVGIILSSQLSAQVSNNLILLGPSTDIPQDDALENLREFDVFSIDPEGRQELLSERPSAVVVGLEIDGLSLSLELVKSNIRNSSFRVTLLSNENPEVYEEPNSIIHFTGKIQNNPNSMVALSLSNNLLLGMISTDDGNYVLEERGEFVVGYYDNIENIVEGIPYECHVQDTEEHEGSTSNKKNISVENRCIAIYIECCNQMFQDFGSNVTSTSNHAEAIFNVVRIIYLRQGVGLQLSEIAVWTVNDPYDNSNTADAYDDFTNRLSSLASTGNRYNGDIPVLFTTSPVGGGRASRAALCSDDRGSVCGITSFVTSLPNYSWSVKVTAHEIGHNLNLGHTHDCKYDLNGDGFKDEQIDDCGSVWDPSAAGSCYDPASPILPGPDGTIMSYCHVVAGQKVNLMRGFHPIQQAEMLDYIDSNPDNHCLTACECATDLLIVMPIPTVPGFSKRIHEVSGHIWALNQLLPLISSEPGIQYRAGLGVELIPGFIAPKGVLFRAEIDEQICPYTFNQITIEEEFEEIPSSFEGLGRRWTGDNLNIYPNPSSDILIVELDLRQSSGIDFFLYDANGRAVSANWPRDRTFEEGANTFNLRTSHLQPGIYFLRAVSDGGTLIQSFMKE